MIERRVYEAPPRPRLSYARMVLPLVALAVAALLVAQWASTTASRSTRPLAAAFLDPGSSAALAMALPAQEPPVPQQPASPQTPLDSLDRRLAEATAPMVTEEMIREREARAAATAFPVTRTLELSSTMYCLKGEMRTGVRTRDGMAAGDPRVLPLGSVVRVSRPNGDLIGLFVIMDTGGAIRGMDIDLYVDSCAEARRWGRHPVVAEVLDIGKRL
ncbi:MAG TPA: 3D domain-containing protein [Longimicrobium sp.]|jgi:3D (Asp-Asp-Asp) domain-containing protein|nr:3D domain-containing protein [Longimicrobium sp.]